MRQHWTTTNGDSAQRSRKRTPQQSQLIHSSTTRFYRQCVCSHKHTHTQRFSARNATDTHTHTGACNSTIEWWKIMEYIIKTCAVCWQNSVQFRVFDCLPRSSLLRHMLEWVGACFDFAFSIYWPAALHKTLQCSRFSAWIRMLSCITKANNAELFPFLWIMPYRRTKKCMNQFHIARIFDE